MIETFTEACTIIFFCPLHTVNTVRHANAGAACIYAGSGSQVEF